MAQPQIIVYSATDVENVPMLSNDQTFTGTNTFDGATVLNGALSGTSVKDEDNMASDSATAVPTQQSVKAYVDGLADDYVYVTGDTMTGDLKIAADNKVLYLGAGDDMSIGYDGTKGVLKTDLVAASDLNIDCGTDKTIVLEESVWDDMRVVPGSFDRPGVTDPTIVAYNVNGGGTSTYLWQFQKNAIASFTIQLPHGYKQGTDIYCHIHWTPGANGVTENGNTVGWKIEYSWTNVNGAFGTMASLDLSDACNGVNHEHNMTPDVIIDGHTATKNISSMLICNIKRTDTGTDDTWTGTASGELPMLLEIDFHYEIDTMGSRQIGTK